MLNSIVQTPVIESVKEKIPTDYIHDKQLCVWLCLSIKIKAGMVHGLRIVADWHLARDTGLPEVQKHMFQSSGTLQVSIIACGTANASAVMSLEVFRGSLRWRGSPGSCGSGSNPRTLRRRWVGGSSTPAFQHEPTPCHFIASGSPLRVSAGQSFTSRLLGLSRTRG